MVCSLWRGRCADCLLRRLHSDFDANVPTGISERVHQDCQTDCRSVRRSGANLHGDLRYGGNFALSTELAQWRLEYGALSGHDDSAGEGAYPGGASNVYQERRVRYHAVDLPLATGLGVCGSGLANPALFAVLLVADLWLLGYHHVVATASSWPSRRRRSGAIVSLRSICCS